MRLPARFLVEKIPLRLAITARPQSCRRFRAKQWQQSGVFTIENSARRSTVGGDARPFLFRLCLRVVICGSHVEGRSLLASRISQPAPLAFGETLFALH